MRNPKIEVGTAGFIRYIAHHGSDLLVVNCARVSFHKEKTELDEKDRGLIEYLAKNNHWTPFGHPQVTLHIKFPISVARQWMRSNVGIVYNEVSRRYVTDPPEFSFPEATRLRPLPGGAKQGSGGLADPGIDQWFKGLLYGTGQALLKSYNEAIKAGVAPEQARDLLPLNTYTEVWMTASLAAVSRIYHLRSDLHAQQEIREYAEALTGIMDQIEDFAHSWATLVRYSQT